MADISTTENFSLFIAVIIFWLPFTAIVAYYGLDLHYLVDEMKRGGNITEPNPLPKYTRDLRGVTIIGTCSLIFCSIPILIFYYITILMNGILQCIQVTVQITRDKYYVEEKEQKHKKKNENEISIIKSDSSLLSRIIMTIQYQCCFLCCPKHQSQNLSPHRRNSGLSVLGRGGRRGSGKKNRLNLRGSGGGAKVSVIHEDDNDNEERQGKNKEEGEDEEIEVDEESGNYTEKPVIMKNGSIISGVNDKGILDLQYNNHRKVGGVENEIMVQNQIEIDRELTLQKLNESRRIRQEIKENERRIKEDEEIIKQSNEKREMKLKN